MPYQCPHGNISCDGDAYINMCMLCFDSLIASTPTQQCYYNGQSVGSQLQFNDNIQENDIKDSHITSHYSNQLHNDDNSLARISAILTPTYASDITDGNIDGYRDYDIAKKDPTEAARSKHVYLLRYKEIVPNPVSRTSFRLCR